MVENEPGMPGTFGAAAMASILHDNETGIVKSAVMCDGHMECAQCTGICNGYQSVFFCIQAPKWQDRASANTLAGQRMAINSMLLEIMHYICNTMQAGKAHCSSGIGSIHLDLESINVSLQSSLASLQSCDCCQNQLQGLLLL